jgi:hypothetical protein
MKSRQYANGNIWSRISPKMKWTIIAITTAVIILALGLGLGLGLTLGGGSGDGGDTAATPAPLPQTPSHKQIWQPSSGATWQIVLQQAIKLEPTATSITPDVDVYDIDLFTNSHTTIDSLHRLGKKVICYFSAGSYEPGRPDSNDFKEADKGKVMDGWPGERWLNLNSDNVRTIMRKRIELAAKKKCDGIDPDNVDGFVRTSPSHRVEVELTILSRTTKMAWVLQEPIPYISWAFSQRKPRTSILQSASKMPVPSYQACCQRSNSLSTSSVSSSPTARYSPPSPTHQSRSSTLSTQARCLKISFRTSAKTPDRQQERKGSALSSRI